MSELNGKWVEAFSVPKGGTTGGWTEADAERMVSLYDPAKSEAPIVIGHPKEGPAYGWVKALRLRQNGKTIVDAQLHQVDPQFADLVKTGRFKQRSVGLYRDLEGTGGPYLRHLGFLGAAAPYVKGLKPIQFGDAEHIEFAVTIEGDQMSNEPKNKDAKKEPALSEEHVTLLTRFAEGFKGLLAKWSDSPTASPDIKDALAKQRQEMEVTFSEKFEALKKEISDAATAAAKKVSEITVGQTKGTIQAFVDKLSAEGKWLPAFQKAYGLQTLMEQLAGSDVVLSFTEKVKEGDKTGDKEIKRPALEVLQRFFTDLPEMVNFDHIAKRARTAAARGGRLAFTEPDARAGKEVVGIELNQKVEALITESKKTNPDRPLTYTEAYHLAKEAEREAAVGQEA